MEMGGGGGPIWNECDSKSCFVPHRYGKKVCKPATVGREEEEGSKAESGEEKTEVTSRRPGANDREGLKETEEARA